MSKQRVGFALVLCLWSLCCFLAGFVSAVGLISLMADAGQNLEWNQWREPAPKVGIRHK